MTRKILIIGACLIACSFICTLNASAAGWYKTRIIQIVPWSDGEVRLQLKASATETKIPGAVRMFIDTTTPGGKNIMATVLIAMNLDSEVTIRSESVPEWDRTYEISAMGLVLDQ